MTYGIDTTTLNSIFSDATSPAGEEKSKAASYGLDQGFADQLSQTNPLSYEQIISSSSPQQQQPDTTSSFGFDLRSFDPFSYIDKIPGIKGDFGPISYDLTLPVGYAEATAKGILSFAVGGSVGTVTNLYNIFNRPQGETFTERLGEMDEVLAHMWQGLHESAISPVLIPSSERGQEAYIGLGKVFEIIPKMGDKLVGDWIDKYAETTKNMPEGTAPSPEEVAFIGASVRTAFEAANLLWPVLGFKQAKKFYDSYTGPRTPGSSTFIGPMPIETKYGNLVNLDKVFSEENKGYIPVEDSKQLVVTGQLHKGAQWEAPKYKYEYDNGIEPETFKEIEDWALSQVREWDNTRLEKTPLQETEIPKVQGELGEPLTGPTDFYGMKDHSTSSYVKTDVLIPRNESTVKTPSPKPKDWMEEIGIDYSHEILPYAMFRSIYNKNAKGQKVKNEKTIRQRFVEYVKGFLPDKAIELGFNDAVLRGFRIWESEQIAKKVIAPKGQRGAIDVSALTDPIIAKKFSDAFDYLRSKYIRFAEQVPIVILDKSDFRSKMAEFLGKDPKEVSIFATDPYKAFYDYKIKKIFVQAQVPFKTLAETMSLSFRDLQPSSAPSFENIVETYAHELIHAFDDTHNALSSMYPADNMYYEGRAYKGMKNASKGLIGPKKQGGVIDLDLLTLGTSKVFELLKYDPERLLDRFVGTFTKDAIEEAILTSNNPKSRTTVVLMSPEDFHSLAAVTPRKGARADLRKISVVKGIEQEGLYDLPLLTIAKVSEMEGRQTDWAVREHEGRHRMDVFKEQGLDLIPVLVTAREGQGTALRWGEVSERPDRILPEPDYTIENAGRRREYIKWKWDSIFYTTKFQTPISSGTPFSRQRGAISPSFGEKLNQVTNQEWTDSSKIIDKLFPAIKLPDNFTAPVNVKLNIKTIADGSKAIIASQGIHWDMAQKIGLREFVDSNPDHIGFWSPFTNMFYNREKTSSLFEAYNEQVPKENRRQQEVQGYIMTHDIYAPSGRQWDYAQAKLMSLDEIREQIVKAQQELNPTAFADYEKPIDRPQLTSKTKMGRQKGALEFGTVIKELTKGASNFKEFSENLKNKLPNIDDSFVQLSYQLQEAKKRLIGKTKFIDREEIDGNEVPFIDHQGRNPFFTISEIFGGKALSEVRQDKYLKPIADKILGSELSQGPSQVFSPTKPGGPFIDARAARLGEWLTPLYDSFRKVQPKWLPGIADAIPQALFGYGGAKVNKITNDVLLRYMTNDKTLKTIPSKLKILGDELRTLLNKFYTDYLKDPELGLSTEYFPNWLPHYFDWVKIKTDPKGLETILTRFGKFTPSQAQEAVFDLIKNQGVIRTVAQRLDPNGIKSLLQGKKSLLARKATSIDYSRKFRDIPTAELMPYLKTDVFNILESYFEAAIQRGEYARLFGANNEKVNKQIVDAITQASQEGKPINVHRLTKLYDLLEGIQGIYKQDFRTKHPWWINIQKGIMTGLNFALLPLVALASFPEAAYPFHRGGVKAYAKAVVNTAFKTVPMEIAKAVYKDFNINGVNKTEAMRLAESIRKAGTDATIHVMSENFFAGVKSPANEYYFRATFQYYWTKMMQLFSSDVYNNLMVDILNKPKPTSWEQQLLDHYGLDHTLGKKWIKQGKPLDGNLFGDKFRFGANRFVEENVLRPNVANIPMWANHPGLNLIRYLHTFPILAGNTVLKRIVLDIHHAGVTEGWMSTATGKNIFQSIGTVAATFIIADFVNNLMDLIRYGQAQANPAYEKIENKDYRRILRGVERSGILGIGNYIFVSIFFSYGHGAIATLLGAPASKFSDIAAAIGSGKAHMIAREMAKLTHVFNINKQTREALTSYYEELFLAIGFNPSANNSS